MFLLAFLAGFEFTSTLCTCVHTVDASARLPEPSASPRYLILGPMGEFGGFDFFGVLLTCSVLFSVIIALIRLFSACVHVHDASALFLGFRGSSWRGFGLAAGKFDFLQSSWDFLTRSGVFVGLLESSARLSVHVHVYNASVELSSLFGSPTRGSAPVAGKSGFFYVTDVFAGVFESLATFCARVRHIRLILEPFWLPHAWFAPLAGKSRVADTFAGLLELSAPCWACMRAPCLPGRLPSLSAFSGHDLLLPIGKSGGFGSVGPVLTRSCMYPAVLKHVCAHDQHARTASGLNLVASPCFDR